MNSYELVINCYCTLNNNNMDEILNRYYGRRVCDELKAQLILDLTDEIYRYNNMLKANNLDYVKDFTKAQALLEAMKEANNRFTKGVVPKFWTIDDYRWGRLIAS